MSVSSVAQSAAALAQQILTKSEGTEKGPDHDGDADDSGVKAAAPVAPTVNTSGQTIGATISTKA
jgi:hypothetical protein